MPQLRGTNPQIVGIVNITADSFSDGGRFLDPAAAMAHASALAEEADIVELGAAASNIVAGTVPPDEEIRRLEPVLDALADSGKCVSIDTCQPAVQRFVLRRGIEILNDIRGFPDPAMYPELAAGQCRLVVMHATESEGRAERRDLSPEQAWQRVDDFFAERIPALERASVARDRLIVDPGMGFFLSDRADASVRALAGIGALKRRFGLPVMISVSRKSFLGALTGRKSPAERGAATLAAELYAAAQGADYIRTHDPGALRDALKVTNALQEAERRYS